MSINATTSSVNSTSQISQSQLNNEVSQKNTSDTSFKDEMEKVNTDKEKDVKKETDIKETETKSQDVDNKQSTEKQKETKFTQNEDNLEGIKSISLSMINNELTNDIRQMMNNVDANNELSINNDKFLTGMLSLDFSPNSLSMTESDAQFFINIAKNDTVNVENIITQGQNMLNSGAEFSEVQKNVNISQTLLDAIAKAKETNQPLRIDFDQNVAVILRINKDGKLSANFIPGDRAVEKYLKDNIESLKSKFDEAELPYSDLSYQSRGSKHQKQQQRNK